MEKRLPRTPGFELDGGRLNTSHCITFGQDLETIAKIDVSKVQVYRRKASPYRGGTKVSVIALLDKKAILWATHDVYPKRNGGLTGWRFVGSPRDESFQIKREQFVSFDAPNARQQAIIKAEHALAATLLASIERYVAEARRKLTVGYQIEQLETRITEVKATIKEEQVLLAECQQDLAALKQRKEMSA